MNRKKGWKLKVRLKTKKHKDMERMLKPKIWMIPSLRTIHRRS